MKKSPMKRMALFALFALCVIVSAFAQEQKITIFLKDASLLELFRAIESRTTYRFSYRESLIDQRRDISISVEQTPVSAVLEQILEGRNLTFEIVSAKSIVITDKGKQNGNKERAKTVTGTVKDAKGEALIGVSILVEGTGNGTTTDLDGRFSLSASPQSRLQFSCIGYQPQTIVLKNNLVLDVVLKEDTELLDELVVVGYGTQKKQNLTGAATTVNMDKILGDRPIASVSTALRGAVPGLQITNGNGEPGASAKWSIRGVTGSINGGGGAPLILVDNVEMDIDMLNPNDIESVTVLKDAASSAIYGARAAFGVILITTKKGSRNDAFHLNFHANWAASTPINLPVKASPWQTVQMYKNTGDYSGAQNLDKWLGLINDYNNNPSAYPQGYVMGTLSDGDAGIKYSLAESDMIGDMMSSCGFQQIYDVAAEGGNKNISYRMSLGYVNEDGILITDKDSYERYSVTGYIASDAKPWIRPEFDFKLTNALKKLPETNVNYGIWGAAVAFPSYYSTGTGVVDDITYDYNTPANFIRNAYATGLEHDNLRLTGRVTFFPLKGWDIVAEYTLDKKFHSKQSFNPIYTYIRCQDDVLEQSATETTSIYNVIKEKTNYYSFNLFGTYNYAWRKHAVKAMVGFSQESYRWEQLLSKKANQINQQMPSISGGVGEVFSDDNFSAYSLRSGFFRLNYNYADKYLFEINGRYDGSSKFPTNARFGLFPSVSAAWRVSQEPFMEPAEKVLSNLKLRFSYGTIGNQNITPYQWMPGMSIRRSSWYVGGNYVYTLNTPALVSNSFTWEKVRTVDVGLDVGFLNNRLSATFDWYVRDTNGMLAEGSQQPSVLGTGAPMENVANLRTQGWELGLTYNGSVGNDIDYYLGFTLYDSRTKISKFDNVSGLLSQYYKGQYINEIWGYTTERYYTTDDFNADGSLKSGIPYVEGYSSPNPGDVLYADYDENTLINGGQNTLFNPGDRRIIGNSTPRYQYGISGGLSYKNFSLSFFLQGVGKRDLWISNELFWPWFDEYSTLMSNQTDYWTSDNLNAYFPRVYDKAKKNTKANRLPQTKYLQNGAYLSIRNVTLSCQLPRKSLKPLGISGASVFIGGENLAIFDHLPQGLSPEAELDRENARGWTYPYLRKWSAGVKIQF